MEPQLEGCGKPGEGSWRCMAAPLQWSRNLRVAESALGLLAGLGECRASMEPQLEGCGKVRAVVCAFCHVRIASMEPQLEGCGKRPAMPGHHVKKGLQWSRNLRVAESTARASCTASAATLQWSRNLRVAERQGAAGQGAGRGRASMEPQLEGCGKLARRAARPTASTCFNGAAT